MAHLMLQAGVKMKCLFCVSQQSLFALLGERNLIIYTANLWWVLYNRLEYSANWFAICKRMKKKEKKKCSPALSPNTEGREWWTVHFQFTPPLTHLLLSSWGSSVAQDTYTQQPKTGDVQPSFNRACSRNTRVISFSRSMPRSILPNLKKKENISQRIRQPSRLHFTHGWVAGAVYLKKKKIAAFGIRSNTRMPRSTFSNKIYFQCRMNGALWVSF